MWLLPTRERPHNLKRFFDQALATGLSTPGRIIVGEEDFTKNHVQYLDIVKKLQPLNWDVKIVQATTLGGAIEETWRIFGNQSKWIGLINDDSMPITENWDERLVSKLNHHTHLVSANDNWQAPARVGAAMVYSKAIIEAMGWLFPPGMTHMFQDDVWETLGRATGMWKVEMDVVVEHWHPLNMGLAQMDETYARANTKTAWDADKKAFDDWKQNQFKECCEKIQEMILSKVEGA